MDPMVIFFSFHNHYTHTLINSTCEEEEEEGQEEEEDDIRGDSTECCADLTHLAELG